METAEIVGLPKVKAKGIGQGVFDAFVAGSLISKQGYTGLLEVAVDYEGNPKNFVPMVKKEYLDYCKNIGVVDADGKSPPMPSTLRSAMSLLGRGLLADGITLHTGLGKSALGKLLMSSGSPISTARTHINTTSPEHVAYALIRKARGHLKSMPTRSASLEIKLDTIICELVDHMSTGGSS